MLRERAGLAWGTCAILIGAWEALALATRRLPTVSTAVRASVSKRPLLTRAGVAAWLGALFVHLTRKGESR